MPGTDYRLVRPAAPGPGLALEVGQLLPGHYVPRGEPTNELERYVLGLIRSGRLEPVSPPRARAPAKKAATKKRKTTRRKKAMKK